MPTRSLEKENNMANKTAVSVAIKNELKPFLDALAVNNPAAQGNAIKSKLAESYYMGSSQSEGILALIGAICRLLNGLARTKALMKMLATLPCPDLETIKWLTKRHPNFDGTVKLTSEAIVELWLTHDGYGAFTYCEKHGWQNVNFRTELFQGTTYHDGSSDIWFFEDLTCGCRIRGDHYHNEHEPRKCYWKVIED